MASKDSLEGYAIRIVVMYIALRYSSIAGTNDSRLKRTEKIANANPAETAYEIELENGFVFTIFLNEAKKLGTLNFPLTHLYNKYFSWDETGRLRFS